MVRFFALATIVLLSSICKCAAWSSSTKVPSTNKGTNGTGKIRNTIQPLYSTAGQTTSSSVDSMSGQSGSYPQYTAEELKAALYSLLEGSSDPAHDGRHLFGFDDYPNHELSKLQSITATRILDYQSYLASEDKVPEAILEDEMKTFWKEHGPLLDLQRVIQEQAPRMALAAEFKRASPSKGNIAVHLDAGEQARSYATAGANVVSVLTEPRWFKGSLEDLTWGAPGGWARFPEGHAAPQMRSLW